MNSDLAGNGEGGPRDPEQLEAEGALSGSTHLPDAVVLCASENRTICAFVNGEAIVWDH